MYNANQKRLEFTIYSQNGYELRELVPAGTYRVYRAYVPGDENGSNYPLIMSESHVTVAEQTTADIVIMEAVDIEKEDSQRYQQAKEENRTEKKDSSIFTDIVITLSIGFVVLGMIIFGTIVIKRFSGRNRYQ